MTKLVNKKHHNTAFQRSPPFNRNGVVTRHTTPCILQMCIKNYSNKFPEASQSTHLLKMLGVSCSCH